MDRRKGLKELSLAAQQLYRQLCADRDRYPHRFIRARRVREEAGQALAELEEAGWVEGYFPGFNWPEVLALDPEDVGASAPPIGALVHVKRVNRLPVRITWMTSRQRVLEACVSTIREIGVPPENWDEEIIAMAEIAANYVRFTFRGTLDAGKAQIMLENVKRVFARDLRRALQNKK